MSDSTRRNFLIATGAGAAAVGMAAALQARPRPGPPAKRDRPHDAEPLVAHIADPSTGTLIPAGRRARGGRARPGPGRPAGPARGPVRGGVMSSHREAPEISKDPVADNTDVYAFVSPDRPDTVTLIANFIPLPDAQRRPELLRVRRRRAVRDPHLQRRRRPGRRDLPVPVHHQGPSIRTRSSTTPARSARSPTPELEPAAVLLGHPGRARRDHGWDGTVTATATCSASRADRAAGQRRGPQHPELRDTFTPGRRPRPRGRPPGVRRPARRRLPRRPRQHLRPGHAAPVRDGPPDPVGGRGRRQRHPGLQRAQHRAPGADQ